MVFDCEFFPSDGKLYIFNAENDEQEPSVKCISIFLVQTNNKSEATKLYDTICENGYKNNPGSLYIHIKPDDNMEFRKSLVENGLKFGFKNIHLFDDNDWCFLNAIINVKRELIAGDIVCIFIHEMCCQIWEIRLHRASFRAELKFNAMIKEDFEQKLQLYSKHNPIILAPRKSCKSLESIFDELILYEKTYTPGNIAKSWNRIPIEMKNLKASFRVEIDGRQRIKFLPQSYIPAIKMVELFNYDNVKLKVFYADQKIVEEAFPKGNVILQCEVDVYGNFSYEIISDFRILLLSYDEMYLYDLEQTSHVMKLDTSNGTLNERLDEIKESLKDDNCRILVAALPGIEPMISSSNWYCMDNIGVVLSGYQKKYQSKTGEYFIALYGGVFVYAVDDTKYEREALHIFLKNRDFKNGAKYVFCNRLDFKKYDGNYIHGSDDEFKLHIENLLANRTNETVAPTKITIFNFECEDFRPKNTLTDTTNCNIVESDPKEYKDLLLDGLLDAKTVQLFESNGVLHDDSRLGETK